MSRFVFVPLPVVHAAVFHTPISFSYSYCILHTAILQLQKEVIEYLEERGVYSEDFANYVQECAELKEQYEYLVWLKGIKEFVTE